MQSSKPRIEWTLAAATDFMRDMEQAVAPHYHVALTGSVLQKGQSQKDLDMIVYPHTSRRRRPAEIRKLLKKAGLRQLFDRAAVTAGWRKRGGTDNKHVEVWHFRGHRVDVIFLR